MKGRKPKDPILKVLEGNRGKKKQQEPVGISTDFPAMPKHFRGEYAETWGAVKVALQDNGYPVRSSDVFALEDLCRCIARVRMLEREIGDNVVVSGAKGERKNPKLQILREYRAAMWRGFERFGLNPVDARRLPLPFKGKTPRERVMEGFDEWNRKQGARQGMSTSV